jgi:hypothetical protein
VIEILIVGPILAASCAVAVALAVQAARRRSRARCERILNALAAEACEALAHDDRSRRTARAIERYDRVQVRVASARTCLELEGAVAGERLRLAAWEFAGRGAVRLRAAVLAGVAARR